MWGSNKNENGAETMMFLKNNEVKTFNDRVKIARTRMD